MVTSKEIKRIEHSAVELTVTVGKKQVKEQYNSLMDSYTKSIQIKGFRKGKVPKDVLERKFGDAFKSEAMGTIMEKALEEIFQEESFPRADRPLPYASPAVKDEPKLDLDNDLTFVVQYDVLPEVKVGTWKGLEIEIPASEVAKEDLDRELEALRERNAIVLDRDEKDTAVKGNVITISYAELDDHDGIVPGSERKDAAFTLDMGQNPLAFDDEIIGMKKDEVKTFTKVYAVDFADSSLAGKTKKFRVTLNTLKEKKLPALDDDLAQDVSEKFKTLADLKASIKDNLEKTLENTLKEKKINAILEQLLGKTEIDLPQSMVRAESESRLRNLSRRFNANPDQLMSILAASGKSPENLMEEWRPDVEKALKSRLIIETLMEEQKLTVEDAELDKEFETMAASMNVPVDEVKKYYEKEEMKEYLKEEVRERKLFDLIFAETKIKKGKKVKFMDLTANNG